MCLNIVEDLGIQVSDSGKYKKHYVIFECNNCKERTKVVLQDLQRSKHRLCAKCSKTIGARVRSSEKGSTFITRATKVHGGTYDYSSTIYIRANMPVEIVCKVHGKFVQKPSSHLSGCGCPKCKEVHLVNANTRANKIAADSFISKAVEVHGNTYDYSSSVYTRRSDKLNIICRVHGEFLQTPSSHLGGSGCPLCSESGFKIDKPATLYYIRIDRGGELFYKVGITNRSVQERFTSEDLKGISILKEFKYTYGKDALDAETTFKRAFKDYQYTGDALLSSGNTEIFIIDVLCVDTK